ncbi:MAG: serine hydrolase [Alphaproteobacteria bacterium]
MRLLYVAVVTAIAAAGMPACASSSPQEGAIRAFLIKAAAAEGAPPAFAVVVVTDGNTIIETGGRTGPNSDGLPVDQNTPFYIASITKSYLGLLASKLHHGGVLSLDATIGEVLPGQDWPEDVDPADVTMRDLLSHSAGINNPALNFRLANFGAVESAEFSRVLSVTTENVESSKFHYTNFAYQLFAYILEHKTGRSWKEWLRTDLLDPLGLKDTGGLRPERPLGELVWGHQLSADGWAALSPKPSTLLHAAGGMYTTPADAARWLRSNLDKAVLDEEMFAEHRKTATTVEARFANRTCSGYTLGMTVCRIGQLPVFGHFGAYAGWRSIMSFSPELNAGVYVLAAADDTAEVWAPIVESQIYSILSDADGAAVAEPLRKFEGEVQNILAQRTRARQAMLDRIAEREWEPSTEELKRYAGTYAHPGIGSLQVSTDGDVLRLSAGVYESKLVPVEPGLFIEMTEAVTYDRIRLTPEALIWGEDKFLRQD